MNAEIKSVIEEYFSSVFSTLTEKYNIPTHELESIFDSLFVSEEEEVKPVVKKKKKKITTTSDESIIHSCVYVFERSGKNNKKGDVCGTKIKGEGDYCSKHKNKQKTATVSPVEKKNKEDNKDNDEDNKEDSKEDNKEDNTCPYVFERKGKNNKKGEVCDARLKAGNKYCPKHKNKKVTNEDDDVIKKKLPKPRIPSKKKKETGVEEVIKENIEKETKPKIILKKHKNLGIFYHAETRFVFQSPIERTIIGKLVEDDLIDPITESDYKLIEKYQFIIG
jgi:hypothetical protein